MHIDYATNLWVSEDFSLGRSHGHQGEQREVDKALALWTVTEIEHGTLFPLWKGIFKNYPSGSCWNRYELACGSCA